MFLATLIIGLFAFRVPAAFSLPIVTKLIDWSVGDAPDNVSHHLVFPLTLDALGDAANVPTVDNTDNGLYAVSFCLSTQATGSNYSYSMEVQVFAAAETYGVNETPSGAALATSNTINASDIPYDTDWYWTNFTFSTPFILSSNTDYCFVLGPTDWQTNSFSGYDGISVLQSDPHDYPNNASDPVYPGNEITYSTSNDANNVSPKWAGDTDYYTCMIVYTTAQAPTMVQLTVTSAYDSPSPSGTTSYLNGTSLTTNVTSPVSGSPGTQYVCTGWTGTGDVPTSGSGTTVTFTITQNSTITWNWKTKYSVSFTVAPSDSGSTTPTGTNLWEDAGPLPVSAKANPYNVFSHWSSNTTSITFPDPNSSSTDAAIDGPGTITAQFAPIEVRYSLTVSVVGNGTVTESPDGFVFANGINISLLFLKGTSFTLTAIPDANWTFQGWSGDLSGSKNPVNVTMDWDKNIIATFAHVKYTLTVNVFGNGTVTLSPAAATYTNGTIVTLTALPSVNWAFSNWTSDLTGKQSPVNIIMNGNRTVTATFTQIPQYYLTVSVIGNGSVTESHVGPCLEGANVTLTAVPGINWRFWNWSGDGSGQQGQTSIIMGGNKTVAATFGLMWDINHDGKVSLADLVMLAKAYGSRPSDLNWNPECDLAAPFNVIGLSDLVTLALHYGAHT